MECVVHFPCVIEGEKFSSLPRFGFFQANRRIEKPNKIKGISFAFVDKSFIMQLQPQRRRKALVREKNQTALLAFVYPHLAH